MSSVAASRLRVSKIEITGLPRSGRKDGDERMTSPVMTATGKVSGTHDEGTGVHSFKGIPFAAPPVGDLRWQAP
ncbi:MAG: carboxylesterase family protein, partial [Caldilineaceae bacterium]|nr:carboxylesterase family protein [Caldilineaceae bacterium]